MSRGLVWILALAPQVALVGGMVAYQEVVWARGAEVVLEVRAYDPMDLVAGRFVRTPLAISRIELSSLPHPDPMPPPGSDVYVRLQPGEKFWTPAAIVVDRREKDGGPLLRGRLTGVSSGSFASLDFGIDRYYIPENAADPSVWDTTTQSRHELTVDVRVDSWGQGHVVELFVDGESYPDWNRAQPQAQPR